MRDSNPTERARVELEKRLVELSGLRNASTRDPGFKLWRQTTLTLIQRTWEGDESRSARFRRVPFSPPSTSADGKELRRWYERGCAEAATLLREMIEEVAQHGIVATLHSEAANDSAAALEALPEDGSPILTLGEDAPKSAPPPRMPSGIARLPQSLAATPHERPTSPPRRGEAGSGSRSVRSSRAARRPASKIRLKDMLGFEDPAGAPAAEEPTNAPARPASDPRSAEPISPPHSSAIVPAATARPAAAALPATRGAAALPSAPAPPEFQTPPEAIDETAFLAPPEPPEGEAERPGGEHGRIDEGTLQRALEAALHSFVARESEPPAPADDLLSTSPVFDSKPRPVRRRGASAPEGSFRSSTAIAIGVVASDVANLGVPDRYRAITRAAMLDLAGHLDRRDLTWQTLREAVHFAMEYPMLARRVLPLLLPYLDQAA